MKMNISKMAGVVMVLLTLAGAARATLITDNWTVNGAVPDDNVVGLVNSQLVSDPGNAAIQDISVGLDISGGYNGDLYGYLVYQPSTGASGAGSSTVMEVLLNQIGTGPGNAFGESGSGFNVTLSGSGLTSIHNATGSPVTGTYTPDSATSLDSTFGGQSADGIWTLYLADLSAGGGNSELVSWGLNISVVPEPVTWALIIFSALLLGFAAVRRFRAARPA
jgi:subtilisin-like proprotein convertase family protein